MTVREQLIERLDQLSDEQLDALLNYTDTLLSHSAPSAYDPENDPIIGLFSGSPDLSRRSKEILRTELSTKSGWTQKER